MSLAKHREEAALFEVSFSQRLNAGETLNTPTIRIEQSVLYVWEDVTDDVLDSTAVTTVGTSVQFGLVIAASATVQRPGTYRVVVTVTTSADQTLIGIAPLDITG